MAINNYHWLVIVVIIAGLWYVSTNLTIEGQDNTVVVTNASPDITVNGVDYKYGQFNLDIGAPTTTWITYTPTQCRHDCTAVRLLSGSTSSRTTQKTPVQLVGKWAGHQAYITINELNIMASNSHINGGNPTLNQGGMEMYNAYYDAQAIPVAGSYILPEAIPAENSLGQTMANLLHRTPPQSYDTWYPILEDGNYVASDNGLGYSVGNQYASPPSQDWSYSPHVMWAAVGDVLYKFEIGPASVNGIQSLGSNSFIFYYYGGYKIRAWVYVPSKYFVPARCGDGHCDPGEYCDDGSHGPDMCLSDCQVCPLTCGNGVKDPGESCSNCPQDYGVCPIYCGNGVCDQSNESCVSCASDCGSCGSPPPDSPQLPLVNQTHLPPVTPTNGSCTSTSQCLAGVCVEGRCVDVVNPTESGGDWFSQETLINGIPNWQILAIAALIILAYVKRKQIKKWL